MAKKNGAQSVETVAGRRIVLSAGDGKTNIDELKWLTQTVLAEGTSIMLKVQAQKNTERSQTGVAECHFATVEEVLAWMQKEVNL